jgi:hypothetical protein
MRVALASREMYPLGGGGIGQYVAAAARVLAPSAEVTVFTSMLYEPGYAQLRAAGDPRVLPESVRVVFVPEPGGDEARAWTHSMHCYSAWLYDRLPG